jgi:SAM-dependent methyltransferase
VFVLDLQKRAAEQDGSGRRGMGPTESLNDFDARMRDLYSKGQVSAEEFFRRCSEETEKLYLSKDNPRAQSGHGSDVTSWRHVRSMILEPITSGGTFIDIGCANGHLIESLDCWMRNTDVRVQFYGLEISKKLYDLAVRRLPEFSSRLFHGNALYWKPPFRFDYVYTMILPDLPSELHREFLRHLFEDCLAPGGKLILGPWNDLGLEPEIAGIGFRPTGYCEKSIALKPYRCKRLVWIDK